MSAAADILAEFGRSLGMERLHWSDAGVVALDFDARGTLYLENLEDDLLIYLVRGVDLRDGKLKLLHHALRLCHYREGLPYTVHSGLKDQTSLVFSVRLPGNEITLPSLEEVLEMLTKLHDKVRES